VRVFESTVALVKELQAKAFGTAIISASRNAERVLSAAGVGDLFPVMVDGLVAERLGLKGKPDPAVFIEAARRLGAGPARTAIVEDAIAGVEAGRGGGFALVIGVDRTGDAEGLREHGADVVVPDLADVSVRVADEDPPSPEPALAHLDGIIARLKTGPAVFLDYDGTLTPIVNDPAAALLSPEMRATVARLARDCPVAMISGRDLVDVKRLVGIEGIIYSGSHGCDIDGPADLVGRQQRGTEFLPLLDEAEEELTQAVKGIGGAWVERKRFAIAVHYRLVAEVDVPRVTEAFDRVAAGYPTLRRSGGKKVHELRPDIGWDKGRVVLWLLDLLRERGRPAQVPLYIGDDVTDEDAFRAIRGQGVTIRVGGPGEATEARYLLADPDEVRTLLDTLATALADGSR
jgi:alpha,alpha-trehalase